MAVTDTDTGTMTETEGTKTPEAEVKTPATEKQVSPEDEPKYSQKQLDLMLQQATSEAGRQRIEAEVERDNLKSQIQTKESAVVDIQAERDSLQTQIEGLTENDPKKFDLVKKDRELKERERQHKENLRILEERETKVNARAEKADAFDAEILMETIAEEYEDGDKAQLVKMCSTAGAKTEETIRQVAEILWGKAKTPKAEKKAPLKKVTGDTKGGGTESLEDLLEKAKHLKGKTPAEVAELNKKITAARKSKI